MLKKDVTLIGKDILLRPVTPGDVTERYYSWMNDPDVNRHMETRFRPQSMEDIRDFVGKIVEHPDALFFAIVHKKTMSHVGNIKLGPVSWVHRRADVSLFVGEKSLWGQGLATQAISLVKDYACKKLKLHKVRAGCYSNNVASAKAFEKAGFTLEVVMKKEFLCGDEFVDRWCFSYFCEGALSVKAFQGDRQSQRHRVALNARLEDMSGTLLCNH